MGGELTDTSGALESLFARTGGATRLGLERTEALLERLGNPQDRFPCIHVAGTNGKGSVVAMVESALRARGLRVGSYTSPHLVQFNERIRIDGLPVPMQRVAAFIDRWTPLVEELGATFFEATTAMAFQMFADAEVDAAVVETGLGGRLDATNVLVPRVACVTGIGLDHVEFLGSDITGIADEKAGIFKRGIPAVIGEADPLLSNRLGERARSAGASRVLALGHDFAVHGVTTSVDGTRFELEHDGVRTHVHTRLIGAHQAQNAASALAVLSAAGPGLGMPWSQGAHYIGETRLPGRFQLAGSVILDVAHNAPGATVLAETLQAVFPGAAVGAVVCVLGDKDWHGFLRALQPVVRHFYLTDAPSAPDSRRWDLPGVAAAVRGYGWEHTVCADFDSALAAARSMWDITLVTGSFHTVGDALIRLQLSPVPR